MHEYICNHLGKVYVNCMYNMIMSLNYNKMLLNKDWNFKKCLIKYYKEINANVNQAEYLEEKCSIWRVK